MGRGIQQNLGNLVAMNFKTLNYFLLIFFLIITKTMFSNELVVKKAFTVQSVTPFLYAFATFDANLTVEDLNKSTKISWKKVGSKGFKKKNDIHIYWLKFNVKCEKSGRYYLENQYSLLEIFQLFKVEDKNITQFGNYGLRNPDLNTPKQKYPTYTLDLKKGINYTFYIKLYKKFAIPSQPIYLYADKTYHELSKKDEREYGMIFGIIGVLIFMGLLTGMIFRLKIYFYYAFYMISLGGILFIANGLFRNYTPHSLLLEMYFTMYYYILITFITLYLMLYKLFDIRNEFPKLHRIIRWKIIGSSINMAINQTAFFYWPNYPLRLYEIGNLIIIIYPIFLFGICFVMYRRHRSEKALYFLILFTFTLLFTVFFSLLPFSFVSHNQLMTFRWIVVFEGIAVLLILHRDLYRSKIDAIELQKNLLVEEKKSIENYLNGLLDERNRIAVELHDSVSANLTALGLKIKNNPSNETNSFYFDELKKIQEDVRKTSHDLHPITLHINSLIPAIQSEIARLENYFEDITFDFSYTNELEINLLSQQLKEIVYFTCCELMQNVLKHANATEITIGLVIENKSLSLIVSDNGIGYQVEQISKGLGLTTIEKRAVLLNGSFTMEPKEKGMVHRFTITYNNE